MMESNYGRNSAQMEKMENVSVPPGFVSLTSFFLKRVENVNKTDKSPTIPTAPEHVDIKPEMNDVAAYNHRPWILLDESSHKPKESHTERLPMVKLEILQSFF